MDKYEVKKLVFSSSATVYGDPGVVEYSETLPVGQEISNPYGQTKDMIEQIIRDYAVASSDFQTSLLRYFNPIGAHKSRLIGEDPLGVPNNLMLFIAQVATSKRDKLSIFGNDYPTPGGTCRRDYIHVVDLALGRIAAVEKLVPGVSTHNLGSGQSTSVLELVNVSMKATGRDVPYELASHRDGDLPEFYADPTKAKRSSAGKQERPLKICAAKPRAGSQITPGAIPAYSVVLFTVFGIAYLYNIIYLSRCRILVI